MAEDFKQQFVLFAERMVGLAARCANEESTKLFLILPFVNFLGYDDRNPDEVKPEHSADFSEKYKNRVDFVIIKNDIPVIAIECKSVGSALKDDRGQLKSYFNAAQTVKLGVITDGLVYEFYADSDEPNIMDQFAFLTVDLREVAKGILDSSAEEGLRKLSKEAFDPDNIGAEAKRKLIFKSLVHQIEALAEAPSETFVRMLLQQAGLSHVRNRALAEYTELTRHAFHEFISLRILQRLDLPAVSTDRANVAATSSAVSAGPAKLADEGIQTSETELAVFNYAKKRLAYLISNQDLFDKIEDIRFRDYKGKFIVFYKMERTGRLFDFREGGAGYNFDFGPQLGGQVSIANLAEIDQLLLAAFTQRVADLNRGKSAG